MNSMLVNVLNNVTMKSRTLFFPVLLFSLAFALVSCNKDETNLEGEKGRITVKITDAPSDDASIEGTFITVAAVKIDGKEVEGFSKQTIEISDLQNGKTHLLFNGDINAGSYSKLSLVLDMATDVNGNAPGSYVLDNQAKKHNLNGGSAQSAEVELNTQISVSPAEEVSAVIDFDLRKSIARGNGMHTESNYSLVAGAELKSAVRLILEEKSGHVKGKVQGAWLTGKNVVVYAYSKGTFNAATELQAQGSGEVRFARAVTSSSVEANGDYHLAFLNEGDYEVYLVSFSSDSNGRMQLEGVLNASSLAGGIILNNISVQSKTSVVVNISISGLI